MIEMMIVHTVYLIFSVITFNLITDINCQQISVHIVLYPFNEYILSGNKNHISEICLEFDRTGSHRLF